MGGGGLEKAVAGAVFLYFMAGFDDQGRVVGRGQGHSFSFGRRGSFFPPFFFPWADFMRYGWGRTERGTLVGKEKKKTEEEKKERVK